ncbi:hypothetical protein C8J57DRAFT_1243837 [Mycena rebaudengoi]|nr:hypothetical protein C8J57DRAFT_1243837 [Mycena rebaudengoi]
MYFARTTLRTPSNASLHASARSGRAGLGLEKIKKYFTREDIYAVVSLCIRPAGKYERPEHSAPSGYQIIPATVVEADRGFLSPENLCRVCPVAGQFTDDQIAMHYEINKVLLNLLTSGASTKALESQVPYMHVTKKGQRAVTPLALIDALGTGKLAVDWQEFVQMLDVYHCTDAYTRYLKWGRKPILKRPREEDVGAAAVENVDQATILRLLGPPPLNKPKN